MFVRMDRPCYNYEMRRKLLDMAEDIFDMQYAFGDCELSYMMLQHARDCVLAVTELNDDRS